MIKKWHHKTPQLTARLALMIGTLFLLFSVLVSALFFFISRNLLWNHHEKSLMRDAYNISKIISEEYNIHDSEQLYEALFHEKSQYNLLLFERLSGTDIWVVDVNHNVFTHQNDTLNFMINGNLPASAEYVCAMAFLGQTICRKGIIDGEETLVAGAPMTNSGGQIVGAVLLCASFSDISRSMGQSLMILAGSLGIALVIILITASLFSRSFVRPIRVLKSTALRLADGDYSAKTNITRPDEVGELSHAMDILAEQLDEARIRGQQAEQEQQEFLSRISHELKTPVTVIRGSLEALDEGLVKTEEEKAAHYHQMLSESIWLQKLITSLLDLTRLQTMDYTLSMDSIDLAELLGDVLMSAAAIADRKQISVICEPPSAPCMVYGDYDRLRQLLMILIDNAVKYSSSHTQITLTLNPDKHLISVQDEGIGIAPEVLPHIFTSYHRGHQKDKNGTGLGLAIAAEIAKRHGFTLQAESIPGQGSRFILYFS